MEKKIIVNMIQTPDGTLLQSKFTHDYQVYKDKNGFTYAVDGGLSYLKRTSDPNAPQYVEKSLYQGDNFEQIRKFFHRRNIHKIGEENQKWIPLCKMSDEWLRNVIAYHDEIGVLNYLTILYDMELDYRKCKGISIAEIIKQ